MYLIQGKVDKLYVVSVKKVGNIIEVKTSASMTSAKTWKTEQGAIVFLTDKLPKWGRGYLVIRADTGYTVFDGDTNGLRRTN